jgi:hypothetical protein
LSTSWELFSRTAAFVGGEVTPGSAALWEAMGFGTSCCAVSVWDGWVVLEAQVDVDYLLGRAKEAGRIFKPHIVGVSNFPGRAGLNSNALTDFQKDRCPSRDLTDFCKDRQRARPNPANHGRSARNLQLS